MLWNCHSKITTASAAECVAGKIVRLKLKIQTEVDKTVRHQEMYKQSWPAGILIVKALIQDLHLFALCKMHHSQYTDCNTYWGIEGQYNRRSMVVFTCLLPHLFMEQR